MMHSFFKKKAPALEKNVGEEAPVSAVLSPPLQTPEPVMFKGKVSESTTLPKGTKEAGGAKSSTQKRGSQPEVITLDSSPESSTELADAAGSTDAKKASPSSDGADFMTPKVRLKESNNPSTCSHGHRYTICHY